MIKEEVGFDFNNDKMGLFADDKSWNLVFGNLMEGRDGEKLGICYPRIKTEKE